jgi:hypothetical protein
MPGLGVGLICASLDQYRLRVSTILMHLSAWTLNTTRWLPQQCSKLKFKLRALPLHPTFFSHPNALERF